MDNNEADNSQALQGLFELLFNLGNLDSDGLNDSASSSNQGLNEVLIESEPIQEKNGLVESEHFSDPFDYVDEDINEDDVSSKLVTVSPNASSLELQPDDQNTDGAIASLQSLLLGSDLQILKASVNQLDHKIHNLEHQIYDPEELIQLLLPVITEILGIKVSQASAEITEAIAPVIDEMITVNIRQDQIQMSAALAPVMSSAIAQNIYTSPGEFANVIAPEMGTAIQEQLRINKGAMVDALYPIIGNTITKYMAEAIKAINEKVENTFSKEGILRKIRARLQGVSEAELILKESIPITIRAIFLIHKASGLIISEVQNPNSAEILESDMVAGMLTAIRSFVNDCITQSGFDAELSEIDYGGSKIMLEAAGHCYLAVVVDGVTTPILIQTIRKTLETIVSDHSKDVENFNGDLEAVPPPIKPALESIFIKTIAEPKSSNPYTLVVLIGLIVTVIAIPWGIFSYRQHLASQLQAQVVSAIFTSPQLSVYGLQVQVKDMQQVELKGRVPNTYLKDLASQVAIASAPTATINNQIIAVQIPPDPIQTTAEVNRITKLLNQIDGIKISTNYKPNLANLSLNKITISGRVLNQTHYQTISNAFAQIPGVAIVTNTIQVQPPQISIRIYFAFNFDQISATEASKLTQIKLIMDQYPDYRLKIIGHSDRLGSIEDNRRIALSRAVAVRDYLIRAGLSPERLEAIGSPQSPQNIPELSRYVGFALSLSSN